MLHEFQYIFLSKLRLTHRITYEHNRIAIRSKIITVRTITAVSYIKCNVPKRDLLLATALIRLVDLSS